MTRDESLGRREPRLPAPGWMPDPSRLDIERYWDGHRWTSRTRDAVSKVERVPLADAPRGNSRRTPRRASRLRRRRRGGGAVVALAAVTAVVWLVAGYMGALPAWAPWPSSWSSGVPDGPEVAYPVFGSDELVIYLARSMVTQDESINLAFLGPGTDQATINDAMAEAITQNPYVFVQRWSVVSQAALWSVEPDYIYADADAEARRAATQAAVTDLVAASGAPEEATDAGKAQAVHDAIAAAASYDFEAFAAVTAGDQSPAVAASQEAYGILVNRTAVCTGYAEAFLLAAEAVGLDAVVVTGNVVDGPTQGGHAWNRVLVDGVWRVVDVTWDDIDGAGGEVRHDYFLVSDGHPLLESRTADAEWVRDEALGAFE